VTPKKHDAEQAIAEIKKLLDENKGLRQMLEELIPCVKLPASDTCTLDQAESNVAALTGELGRHFRAPQCQRRADESLQTELDQGE